MYLCKKKSEEKGKNNPISRVSLLYCILYYILSLFFIFSFLYFFFSLSTWYQFFILYISFKQNSLTLAGSSPSSSSFSSSSFCSSSSSSFSSCDSPHRAPLSFHSSRFNPRRQVVDSEPNYMSCPPSPPP